MDRKMLRTFALVLVVCLAGPVVSALPLTTQDLDTSTSHRMSVDPDGRV